MIMLGSASLGLLFLLLWSPHTSSQECSTNSPTIRFILTSRRNTTGHWINKVNLLHPSVGSNQYQIQVEGRPEQRGGVEMIHVVAQVVGPERPFLDTSYHLVPDIGYYKVHTTIKNWHAAKYTCEEEGAHLLVVNSGAEAAAVMNLYAKYPNIQKDSVFNSQAFMGVTDERVEADYRTIFGDPLSQTGYVRWAPNQPTNLNNVEHCLTFYRNGEFNDAPCSLELAFICEQELSGPHVVDG